LGDSVDCCSQLEKGVVTTPFIGQHFLWGDTRIVPCDSHYGQYSAHGVATGTTEYATRAGSLLRHHIGAIHSKRSLFRSLTTILIMWTTVLINYLGP